MLSLVGDYSVELCGVVLHVGNAEVVSSRLSKKKSGTVSILAVTGKEAFEAYRENKKML